MEQTEPWFTEEQAASNHRNILEEIGAIVKACALMTTAIEEGRYTEGNAWLAQIRGGCGTIDDNMEALLHEEHRNKLGLRSI